MILLDIIKKITTSKYTRVVKMIEALDVDKLLIIADNNRFAIEKIDGVEIDTPYAFSGTFDGYHTLENLESVTVYPCTIIKMCDTYGIKNIELFVSMTFGIVKRNILNNIVPTDNVIKETLLFMTLDSNMN